MDFIKRRPASSSDDSDDEIPPTPAAKSTPLVSSNRLRKQSSSSDSSSNGGQNQTPRVPVQTRRPAESDSSSDEDNNQQSLPRHPHMNVKQERRDSSSEEEVAQQRNVFQGQIVNRLNSSRPAHTMSSSDDSDMDTTAVNNHPPRTNESSSESDDDVPSRPSVPVAVLKSERPSPPDSSDDSSDDDGAVVPKCLVAHTSNAANSSSSSEGESAAKQQVPLRREETSSENRKVAVRAPATANGESSDESEDERRAAVPQLQRQKSSSESSSDEEPQQKTVIHRESRDDSDSDSDSGNVKQNPISKAINSRETSSSDEEEEPASKPLSVSQSQKKNTGNESSDDDTSEDEEENVKPQLSALPKTNQQNDSSEEGSSDGEEARTIKQSVSMVQNLRQNTEDSSEKESGSDNDDHQIFTSTQRATSDDNNTLGGFNQWKPLSAIFSPQIPTFQSVEKSLPSSGKLGSSLLKETFRERERLCVQDPPLTHEDIGSDDEIWLLQCPKSMDIRTLKKQHINLASDSEIQLENGPTFKRFSISPEVNGSRTINCVLPAREGNKFQISFLPVKGKVVIQEHIHVPKLRMPEVSAKLPVPFPTGLKVRHPLLGIGFEEHIAKAKLALKEGERYNKHQNKIKRKEMKKRHSSGNGYSEESLLSPSFKQNMSEHSQSSEKRKHKESNNQNISNISQEESGKKRKKNISYSSDTAYSSEAKSIDGSFLNETKKTKHKKSKKGEINGEHPYVERPSWHVPQSDVQNSPIENGMATEKKKKKKSKHDVLSPTKIKQERLDSGYANGMSETLVNDTSFSKKRKRKEAEELTKSDIPLKKKKKHSI